MSKGPMSKGCPRRRGEARADDKMHSAHSASLKRQQRARQNQLVATLDSLLPTEARCKPFKGAGPRSTGAEAPGRSVPPTHPSDSDHADTVGRRPGATRA